MVLKNIVKMFLSLASLHNIRQEYEEMCPKEDSGANKMAVLHIVRDFPVPSVSSELPHKGDKPALPPKVDKPRIDKEEITVQPLTNVSSADKPRPTHMEKPKRIKDLRELLKISTNENDRLRSELLTLTKKLESVENAFETFKKEHKLRVEESVKLVETTTLDQSSVTDRDELRTAQEELAKEKQIRMIVEKRLKVANTKISDLIKRLKEKDRELLTYKAEREDLKKADEDQKEEKRIQPESPGQPTEANEKKAEPIQRLDYITNRTSEIDATSETQKRLTRADTDLEISDSDLKLFARQVKGRKKSQRPHLRTGMQVKSLDLDDGNYLEADLGKHESKTSLFCKSFSSKESL